MCGSSPSGPSPAIPTSAAPGGLTCEAHGAEQFLKLLELLRGQEQVQGTQLSSHLQLGTEGARGAHHGAYTCRLGPSAL